MINDNFFPFKTVLTSSVGESYNYADACPNVLTLQYDYIARRFQMPDPVVRHDVIRYIDRFINRSDTIKTMFHEVLMLRLRNLLSYTHRDALRGIGAEAHNDKVSLLSAILDELTRIVYDTWKPDSAHVIMHSSGLDSRLISWIIKRLHLRHGDDWLGDVAFLCSKRERVGFVDIMRYEDWDDSQWHVVNDNVADEQYYRESLTDFDHAWSRLNGMSAIPVNLYWYPVEWALNNDYIPLHKPIQMYTGCWGNTVLDNTTEQFRRWWMLFYYSVLCYRPYYCDEWIHPYSSSKIVAMLARSELQFGKRLRYELISHADRVLLHIPATPADGDRGMKIADDILAKVQRDYNESWYGKNVVRSISPPNNTEFNAFWSHWSAASLCEELLRRGHKIHV